MTQQGPEEGDYFVDQDARTDGTRRLRVERLVNPYGRGRTYAILSVPGSGRETTVREDRLARPSLFRFDGRDG